MLSSNHVARVIVVTDCWVPSGKNNHKPLYLAPPRSAGTRIHLCEGENLRQIPQEKWHENENNVAGSGRVCFCA